MKVAVIGATGMVGNVVLQVLEERRFPITELILAASKRSLGKKVRFQSNEISILSIFAISYFLIFKGVRNRLNKNGTAISEVNEQRFRLMNEGFGGIKDVLLMGRDHDFINRFNKTGKTLAYSQGTNTALAQAPRYFVELLAFGSMILLILYLIASHDGNLGMILPIISVYAIGTIKLLPAFQQIYSSIAIIKANIPAFESIQQDLYDSSSEAKMSIKVEESYLHPKKQISLEKVTFTYPNKQEPALDRLSITIPVNSVIGIVGPSGSGKSTLLNLLSGIDRPDEGTIMLGSTDLANASENELAKVRRHEVSTVFQFFHLLPTLTAAENIDISMQIDIKMLIQNYIKINV